MVSDSFLKKRTTDSASLIQIEKNVYDKRETSDGTRILVMRLWPRGVKKTSIDTWMKELGTPKELIKQWKSGKIPFESLRKRYVTYLKADKVGMELANEIADRVSKGNKVTLLCSCKKPLECHRSILKEIVMDLLD